MILRAYKVQLDVRERSSAYRGGVWMCKIKTYKYFDKLKNKFGEKWTDYAE